MNDKRSLVIKLLILLIIIFIILIIVLIKVKKTNQNELEDADGEDVVETFGKTEDGNVDEDTYFVLKICIDTYLNTINTKSDMYNKLKNDNSINESIYNLLSLSYIENNDITEDNVLQYIKIKEEQLVFAPLEMKLMNDEYDIKSFIAHGYLQNDNFQIIDEIFLIINIDPSEMLFSIEPIHTENSIEDIKIEDFESYIDNNGNNNYTQGFVTGKDISNEYIDILKKMTLGNERELYKHFDKEYAEKTFGGIEGFKKYVEENKEKVKQYKRERYYRRKQEFAELKKLAEEHGFSKRDN